MKKKCPRKLYCIFQLGFIPVSAIQKIKGSIVSRYLIKKIMWQNWKTENWKQHLVYCLAIICTLPNEKCNKICLDSFFSIYLLFWLCQIVDPGAVWSMIQYTYYFLLPLIYKRDHLLFANCSINFHMNKFLGSMLLQFISCLVGNHQTTKLWVYTRVMFSAGIMTSILCFQIKFLVIYIAKKA